METQIEKEKIGKEMDRLEYFLLQIKAKYEKGERSIEIKGEIFQTYFNNIREPQYTNTKVTIKINEGQIMDITQSNGIVIMEYWNGDNFKMDFFSLVKDIIILKDTIYIFF